MNTECLMNLELFVGEILVFVEMGTYILCIWMVYLNLKIAYLRVLSFRENGKVFILMFGMLLLNFVLVHFWVCCGWKASLICKLYMHCEFEIFFFFSSVYEASCALCLIK